MQPKQKTTEYKIPHSGPAREALRVKGQFWTPAWIADAMVCYVLADQRKTIFDPAVGAGAFFVAAKKIASTIQLQGFDVDAEVLQTPSEELSPSDFANVKIADFVLTPPAQKLPAIVANPPYIRHHRLSAETKERLRKLCLEITGQTIDGRAGLHVYFLLRALQLLQNKGRLAFILPADICEGVFAKPLWQWLTKHYCLEAIVTFAPEASPFPNIDTNPIIVLLRRAIPQATIQWAYCHEAETDDLWKWMASDLHSNSYTGLTIHQRDLSEALATGLSRAPQQKLSGQLCLGDLAKVVRGVATGANEFFFLTCEQIKQIGLPEKYFVNAVGRTRDVKGDQLTDETLGALQQANRPTKLLALNGEPLESYPASLRTYLQYGESLGLAEKPLISQRRIWYKMESRIVPPILFAYLGRRNSRFIRNHAGAIPLTSFLCVYPHRTEEDYVRRLWQALNHPETIANLALTGKSYGAGAVKVEPRALERLLIPEKIAQEFGLTNTAPTLFEM
ncbi:MAG: SAM-dependent DNA methyltransferase [Acidobacteria bacterium]|nr:SAM-dependent DNA methyltransferase [Acidobacteriota bacterium]